MRRSRGSGTFNAYIGIDNGVSGSFGIIAPSGMFFVPTPVMARSEQDYVKTKRNITRIISKELWRFLRPFSQQHTCKVMMERPMIDPSRFRASVSAIRALESTSIILEMLQLPFEFIDAKQWRTEMLPTGAKGADQWKALSKDVGTRMFPQFTEPIRKHKDADGILIAEYCRRFYK